MGIIYSCLNNTECKHRKVNYTENLIGPDAAGANTQTIESIWSHLKFKISSKMLHNGTNPENMLPRHLNNVESLIPIGT